MTPPPLSITVCVRHKVSQVSEVFYIKSDMVLCFSSRNFTRSLICSLFFSNTNFFTHFSIYSFYIFPQLILKIHFALIEFRNKCIVMYLKIIDFRITTCLVVLHLCGCHLYIFIHVFQIFHFNFTQSSLVLSSIDFLLWELFPVVVFMV